MYQKGTLVEVPPTYFIIFFFSYYILVPSVLKVQHRSINFRITVRVAHDCDKLYQVSCKKFLLYCRYDITVEKK